MLRCRFVAPVFVTLLAAAGPASAASVTTAPGAPDPGKAEGETLLVTFDTPNTPGVTGTSRGAVITAAGSIGSIRAAPAGTPEAGIYQSIGTGGDTLFDFAGWAHGRPLASASLYWGSVDSYNFVDFLDAGGNRIGGIGGGDLPMANGNQALPDTNRRVYFTFAPQEAVTALRLRSTGAAFEFDNMAASIGAVPEPASWAMLITGFGFIGGAMRLRKDRPIPA